MSSLYLGGNIELVDADNLDRGALVVVKKIVGNYARRFSERGLERLSVSFKDSGVSVAALAGGRELNADSSHENVFFSIDKALREIERQL